MAYFRTRPHHIRKFFQRLRRPMPPDVGVCGRESPDRPLQRRFWPAFNLTLSERGPFGPDFGSWILRLEVCFGPILPRHFLKFSSFWPDQLSNITMYCPGSFLRPLICQVMHAPTRAGPKGHSRLARRRHQSHNTPSLARRSSSNDGWASIAYFGNWDIYDRNFMPHEIPADRVTHLLYSFANIASDGTITLSDANADTDKLYSGDDSSESVSRPGHPPTNKS